MKYVWLNWAVRFGSPVRCCISALPEHIAAAHLAFYYILLIFSVAQSSSVSPRFVSLCVTLNIFFLVFGGYAHVEYNFISYVISA